MSSTYDVYSTQPAFPFLASSLLATYDMRNVNADTSKDINFSSSTIDTPAASSSTTTSSWNLRPDFDEFRDMSKYRNHSNHLFRCGITLGLSYLRELNTSNPDQNRDLLGDISRKLLADFLLGLRGEETNKYDAATRVYIVHPTHSTTFSPHELLEALLNIDRNCPGREGHPPPLSRDQAIDLLDHVQLLSVHDFASASQAISQVSDILYQTEQQRYGPEPVEQDDDDNQESHKTPAVLLIIEGLDTMAENLIRNSNAMRGSAVLMPALRTLTYLSRTYAAFLSIMLLNTTGLGPSLPPSAPPPSSLPTGAVQTPLSQQPPRTTNTNHTTSMKSAGGLYSAFSRTQTRRQDDKADDIDGDDNEPLPLLHTLLSRTVDQGLDIHLLFQIRRNQLLVEVIKDRNGDGLGKWCEWV
ncbi:hypothetical protein BGW36DRAFT_463999 [Talaromyces proteolyticus]|uniref:Uncharacterized protein n=1 Tax=Talaromyces proteolyticus TaxID=1131652 RepID=A0AAD4PWS2_9EURO|nr:uncharacterized protein BGW36DRAFT_463999 [Talaromyces proteolyticus]KAH8692747.1 hypothetical protein BGW36DRAFT_463999 [Talaromyces proteolyticus]